MNGFSERPKVFWRAQLWVFFLVYFIQKLTGIIKLPLRNTLRQPLEDGGMGLSAADAGYFLTAVAMGWYVKALLGMITDRIPLFGYRRKSWLLIASLGTSVVWLRLAVTADWTLTGLFMAMLAVNVFISFADVICDGFMVESGHEREVALRMPAGTGNRSLQTAQWLGATSAMVIASIIGGVVAQFLDLRTAAWLCALPPAVVAVAALFWMQEQRVAFRWKEARSGIVAAVLCVVVAWVILTLKQIMVGPLLSPLEPLATVVVVTLAVLSLTRVPRHLLAPLGLMLLWRFTPFNTDTQYLYQYFTVDAAVFSDAVAASDWIREWVEAIGSFFGVPSASLALSERHTNVAFGAVLLPIEYLGSIVGLICSGFFLGRMSMVRMLRACMIGWILMLAIFGVVALGACRNLAFVVTAFALCGFIAVLYNTVIMFYAAGVTSSRDAATLFALLLGLSNVGVTLGGETIGGWLYTHGKEVAQHWGGGITPAGSGLLLVLGAALVHAMLVLGVLRRTGRAR